MHCLPTRDLKYQVSMTLQQRRNFLKKLGISIASVSLSFSGKLSAFMKSKKDKPDLHSVEMPALMPFPK